MISKVMAMAPILKCVPMTLCNVNVAQMSTYKYVVPSTLTSIKARSFAAPADSGVDAVKEMTKIEEWEKYVKTISNDTPIIVEFFAKLVTIPKFA